MDSGILKKNEELQFLPAAIEVQDTPPSPAGRSIVWGIAIFFVCALVWATYGKLDIVAVAQGKVIPIGHSKTIQPLETGSIKEIYVSDGQVVKKGELLIRLDDETVVADLRRIEYERINTFFEKQRLQSFVGWLEKEKSSKVLTLTAAPPASAYPSLVEIYVPISQGMILSIKKRHQLLLDSQVQEYKDRMRMLRKEMDRLVAEQRSAEREADKLKAILPIVDSRASNYLELSKKKMLARDEFLRTEQQRLEYFHDLEAQAHRVDELGQAVEEVKARKSHVESEYLNRSMDSLQDAERRFSGVNEEYVKLLTQLRRLRLVSPIDGVIEQLSVHTQGGVVTPAQELMKIVPLDQVLEVEAFVENKDVGFVEEGQAVVVKVDAFPFTKYGLIDGVINNLSDDAVADETKGFVYKIKVAMKKSDFWVNGKVVPITPGMTVSVEAKTGKRRVIEYFLAPLLRKTSESIRER